VKLLSGAPLLDRLLALPENIRLGWKSLSEANPQAYWAHLYVTKKIIVVNGPQGLL
jgi:hypothetical protein